MNVIEINNLEKRFKDLVAVNKINLNVKEKEIFSLLGVNGAGKTTTIRMLTGLCKPTSGDAKIFGKSILTDMDYIKKFINVSPQETAIAPNLTIRENLQFICGIYNIKDNVNQRINDVIQMMSLEKVANRKAKYLSGGYQRKLSIALAIITEPKLLFLDEPTLGLDVIARRELWEIIRKLKETATIVLTTHYMEEAEMLSDELAIMKDGNICFIGNSEELVKKTKAKNFEDAFVNIVSRVGDK